MVMLVFIANILFGIINLNSSNRLYKQEKHTSANISFCLGIFNIMVALSMVAYFVYLALV